MDDKEWLLECLHTISLLAKMSQQWDRSEISNQNFRVLVLENSRRLLLLADSSIISSKVDLPLVERLLELELQQELSY